MRKFLFQKIKLRQEDKANPLCYSLASRAKIPYLLDSISGGGHALDLGCGIGFFSNIIAKSFSKITAIDPDAKSIEKARALYGSANIEFISAAAEKIPLPDDSVDFLLSSEVLEHVSDLEQALGEAKRVCKDCAIFFITVPSTDGIFGNFFLKIGHKNDNLYEEHKKLPFTKKDVSLILLKNNFQIGKIYYSKISLAEIFMGLTKLLHDLKRGEPISGQSDILMPPRIYRIIFPFILFLAKLEDFILNNVLKGHMIIITGKINK